MYHFYLGIFELASLLGVIPNRDNIFILLKGNAISVVLIEGVLLPGVTDWTQ